MFHFGHPISQSPFYRRHHHQTSQPSRHSPPSLSFEEYDAQRSALEQEALLTQQRERRHAEEALYIRRARDAQVQQLLAERQAEEDLRQRLAYEHALREVMAREKVAREATRKAEEELYLRKVMAMRERQQPQEQQQQDVYQQLQSFLQQSVHAQPSTPTPIPEPRPTVEAPETVYLTFQRSPSPVPVQSSPPVTSEHTDELKRHHVSHLARRQTLAKLSALSASLKSHQSTFSFPSTLIFSPSPPASQSDSSPSLESPIAPSPKLAYSSQNATFLAYEDFLVSLLSKVDEVESKGDTAVKDARKELVRKIEQELSMLDQGKERKWVEYLEKREAEVDDVAPLPENLATAPTTESDRVLEKQVEVVDVSAASPSVEEASNPDTLSIDSTTPQLESTPPPNFDEAPEDSTPAHLRPIATTPPLVNAPLDSTSISSEPSVSSASVRDISSSAPDSSEPPAKVVKDSDLDAAIETVIQRASKLGAEIVRSENREKDLKTKERQGSGEDDFELV